LNRNLISLILTSILNFRNLSFIIKTERRPFIFHPPILLIISIKKTKKKKKNKKKKERKEEKNYDQNIIIAEMEDVERKIFESLVLS
jgi:hypothetical protein